MRKTVILVALLATFVLGGAARPAQALENYQRQLGWGMAAFGAGLLYSPAKVVYATLGGFVGGLTYVWTGGNIEVSHRVWSTTLGGTYVVTPAMLRGEESILFAGETYGW